MSITQLQQYLYAFVRDMIHHDGIEKVARRYRINSLCVGEVLEGAVSIEMSNFFA